MKRSPLKRQSLKQKRREAKLAKLPKPLLCEKCGKKRVLDWHHKVKRSQGGQDTRDNLVALCRECHIREHGVKVI